MSASLFDTEKNIFSRREILLGLCATAGSTLFPYSAAAREVEVKKRFVEAQVKEITRIISLERFDAVLLNRYLASMLYYSERFLNQVVQLDNHIDVPLMIVRRVRRELTFRFRNGAFAYFESIAISEHKALSKKVHAPLRRFSYGHGANHVDALDLFAREGSSVLAHAGGLVILTDDSWQPGNQYSAASHKGGNTVIVFNPVRNELCRYAHLREVSVTVGDIVSLGSKIGVVGNTGTNASRPGHGGHLHFEINTHNPKSRTNDVVSAAQIRRRLDGLR
jgi:murein DD-endopeptidase MepM/ murein hydrolase activator NlpD